MRYTLRTIFWLASMVLATVLVELPWSDGLPFMEWSYLKLNFIIIGGIGTAVYFLGQRTRFALGLFVGLCLLVGIANAYIVQFKGQPIVPADLFALSTAASVSGGYSYVPNVRMVGCALLYLAYLVLLVRFCPRAPLGVPTCVCNTVVAIVLCVGCFHVYNTHDIKEDYEVKVDVWDVRGSYSSQGTPLCFLSRTQELTPKPPDWYSDQAVEDILSSTDQAVLPVTGDQPTEKLPHVICVMNETFSDISTYPGLRDAEKVLANYRDIAQDALMSGTTYVSALGGGTCNSEFEFLSGATMGNMGQGVYPYVLYDVDHTANLTSYFKNLGYETHAIHPAEATNWRRNVIYKQLGFDEFDDIETLREAPTVRGLVSDRGTYDRILEKLDAATAPQFVFDVTLQNHGGYESGELNAEKIATVEGDSFTADEVNEFLALMKCSDEDLRYLIDELQARDYPVYLCFFGDHQPGFTNALFEATEGHSVDDSTLEEVQERFCTPYMIWANDAARAEQDPADQQKVRSEREIESTSLNYLGGMLIDAAGLPRTTYYDFLASVQKRIPVINMNGLMNASGEWKWFFEANDDDFDAVWRYRIIQYDNLFDKDETLRN